MVAAALPSAVLGANIFENGTTSNVSTMATDKFRGDDLTFNRSGGNVTVTGPQNVTANVGKPIVLDNNKRVLPIDKVLMGGECTRSPLYCDVTESVQCLCKSPVHLL